MKYMSRTMTALGIAAIAGFVALVAAQESQNHQNKKPAPSAGKDNSPAQFSSQVTRVNMLFTVTDKHGRFVTDLDRDDFEIFENKKEQRITEFTSETDLPLRLAILVDTSNSIRDRFRFQQEAAVNFVNGVMRDEDKAIVVSFDSSSELVADLTSDTAKLESAIRDLRPGGGTSLFDAIFFSCRDKLMQDQPLYKFRRAMIILSDGDDNNSRTSRDQALEMGQKADVMIYTISTNISRQPTEGDKIMRYFAQQTGGIAFFPFQASDLNQSFENIANELRHQYNLFYRPEPLKNDGVFHNVEIKVRGRKDLVVRARKGYYARRA
jgi:Ca-activated chloride channel family protein